MFDWNYWLEIFTTRAAQLIIRRPERDDWLGDEECRRIGGSRATFQLGEQSEGRTLLRFSEKFATQRDIPALPAVTALFIREEQHHAAQLKEFMLANGIPLKKKSWTDSIFRVLEPSVKAGALSDSDIEAQVAQRTAAKKARDFALADRIRDQLLEQGIILEDTKSGVRWKRK